MDRIIHSLMADYLQAMQIHETEESDQFERFSSYCTIAQHYEEQYDIEDVILGGGNDCGIDSLAIVVNGHMVTSVEEIDDLININKGLSDITFILTQAKTTPGFSSGDIGTFGAGAVDFFSVDHHMVRNDKVEEKGRIIDRIFQNAAQIKRNPECYLYYVTTGKWEDDQNCNARINPIVSDLLDMNIFSNVRFIPVGSKQLQQFYRETKEEIETTIRFEKRVLLPEIPNIDEAYLGYVSFREYLKLISYENGDIRRNVFYDNVRDYQGNENKVNAAISNTITTNGDTFMLLNNGVTIICKSLSCSRDDFTLKGYQIVNGCQTSHALYNNKHSVNGNLFVPVKIIETSNDETINSIIKGTNSQTTIPDEQLLALTEFHRSLEAYYQTFSGNDRLYYERRSKQYSNVPDIDRTRIITVSMQIKSVAAMFFDKPNLSSRYYGTLLKETDGLFADGNSYIVYYTSAFLLFKLDNLFKLHLIPPEYKKYRYHMLMQIKYDLAQGSIPLLNSRKIEGLCTKILDCAKVQENLLIVVERVKQQIDKYVTDLTDKDMVKSVPLVDSLRKEYLANR